MKLILKNREDTVLKKIYLKVPKIDELYYRKEWLKAEKTMSYNAGYDMEMEGYDKVSGTICKTDEQMQEWYKKWTKSHNRYIAYIYDAEMKIPVGEVYF